MCYSLGGVHAQFIIITDLTNSPTPSTKLRAEHGVHDQSIIITELANSPTLLPHPQSLEHSLLVDA